MRKQKSVYSAKASEGVSTLDFLKGLPLIVIVLVLLVSGFGLSYRAAASGGHSTLDILDQTFNAQLSTSSYTSKAVNVILPLPDGKILVAGRFNSYDEVETGGIVRLHPNGSLDYSFNASAFSVEDGDGVKCLAQLPNGKTLVGGVFSLGSGYTFKGLVRLNPDGSLDSTFAYNALPIVGVKQILVRPNGKILLSGDLWTIQGNSKSIVQLNEDGSFDTSFDFPSSAPENEIALQGDKVIVVRAVVSGYIYPLLRLNEDGSVDSSFPQRNIYYRKIFIQSDNKIVVFNYTLPGLYRLNADGTDDPSFTITNPVLFNITIQADGKILTARGGNPILIDRLLPDGTVDPTFSRYSYNAFPTGFAVQADGQVLLGEETVTVPFNNNYFVRLYENGSHDTLFNAGGTGFQNKMPGRVSGIAVQPDNRILIGGKFDLVNNTSRNKIARLTEDGALDDSFQVSMTGTNRFTALNEIYNIYVQPDSKIIVSGYFSYIINGAAKESLARLNTDGSLDPTFSPNMTIGNLAPVNAAGTNKGILMSDGRLVLGTSRSSSTLAPVPIRLNANGTRDTSFSSNLMPTTTLTYIYDLVMQADGKIVVCGRYATDTAPPAYKSFMARLNSDGSVDPTFPLSDELQKTYRSLAQQTDGKILAAKSDTFGSDPVSDVVRFNSNGSPDATFNTGAGANGKLNALLLLPDGKILVGGKFNKFNNQTRLNLALLNADGSLDPTLVNVNQEVLSLTLDNNDRVLIGGAFTVINAGGGYAPRTYVARLLDATQIPPSRPRFDFDGDRRADLAVFNQTSGVWSIYLSQTSQTTVTQFGATGDITVPADYDGDGKTDIAVYRPAEGYWYLRQSGGSTLAVRWGAPEDKPVAADYDGDGKADIAVWRPSNGVWYILQSSNNLMRAAQFGQSGDVALRETDFDGDRRADIAVYRPSNGMWFWLASANNQFRAEQFGQNGDIPVAADYNTDGKTDLAVYRPSTSMWYRNLTTANGTYTFSATPFGLAGDVPIAADYNGDGATDIAVRRGDAWHLLLSTQGYSGAVFGTANEQAVEAATASQQP